MTREEAINEVRTWAIPSEKGREVLETLIPELAESDDERIRKFLIQHISGWIGCIEHDLKNSSKDIESEKELAMFKAGLAYLEKQKESLPISETCKENANSFTDGIIEVRSFQRGMEEGRKLEKQEEQKQAQTSEEKEYVRTIKSIISDFIRDKKPENLAYYQRIYDWLDGRHVPFSCGHENGEPADPVFSKQEYESYPIISEDTTSAKPRERSLEDDHIIGFVYDLLNEIEWKDDWAMSKEECLRLLSNYSPQKPTGATINDQPIPTENHSVDIPLAEWSEEDEKTYTFVCNYFETCWWSKTWDISREQVLKMLKSLHSQSKQEWKEEDEEMRDTCIDLLEHFPRPCGEVIGPWKDCISWLKSLRPQPKQEWSEEDEKDVAHIIRVLDDCYAYGKHDLSKTDHENLVGTLKSLCLQPKLEWSEEDEHRRDEIIQWLREYQAKFNLKYDSLSIDSIESLIDWLKSLRPSKNKM